MEENRVLFDVSSNEEPALDVSATADDYCWLKKLLCDDLNESDDVVVRGEIKSKSSEVTVTGSINDDDEDCVVLDGDPDQPVAVTDAKADDDCGDLVIVSHKGQVACRDYPHPRHLCAKFLFGSTAHDTHCDMCHCYVCDIPAPCAHWGTGFKSIDHCHATEKEEIWKSQRKTFRLEKNPPLPAQAQVPNAPLSLPQINQVSRPAVIRGCSNSGRLTIPNMIRQFRSKQCIPALSRNRIPRCPLSQPQNHRVNSPGTFKRAVNARGGMEAKPFAYGSTNNMRRVCGSQCSQNPAPLATSNDMIDVPGVPSTTHDSFTYQSTSQTGIGNVFMSSATIQSQVYSKPLSQPEVYSHPMSQPQLHSHASPLSNEGQNVGELGNRMHNSTGPNISEFDEWLSKSSQSNQPPQFGNSQVTKTGCVNGQLLAEEFNPPCNGSAKLQHNNFSEFENWYPESQFGQVSEGHVPSDMNAVTYDPPAYDAGMLLFDFETSFNSLAHA